MKNILTEALVNSATNASFIFSYTNSAKLRRQGYQVLILEKDTILVRLLQKIWIIGVLLISIQCSIIDIEKGILFL